MCGRNADLGFSGKKQDRKIKIQQEAKWMMEGM